MNYPVEPRLERSTIEFYLSRAHEFVGSPMLSALLGVYAAPGWIDAGSAVKPMMRAGMSLALLYAEPSKPAGTAPGAGFD